MSGLLFLSHRIPYPPNKGDKIRSYHMLKYLARRYEVYLGTFIDNRADEQYRQTVADMCAGSHFACLRPGRARLRSLPGLLRGDSLTERYYRDRGLSGWVRGLMGSRQVQKAFVFSSAMAQYLPPDPGGSVRKVVDFVDIDSDKWAQYSRTRNWPLNWIYRHEAIALGRFERRVADMADASVFVSEPEANLFRQVAPEAADRVTHIENGVDTEYFSPNRYYETPYDSARKVVVFTGAMDYWPNIDAAAWFAHQVFPLIRERVPDAWFYIVGARPTPAVKKLSAIRNVCVTGTVEDVRPYLAHAAAAVAPMKVARGVQNKVLEAMAMDKSVVATSMAKEGLAETPAIVQSDDAGEFSACVVRLLQRSHQSARPCGSPREFVTQRYDWEVNLGRLADLLEDRNHITRVGT